jgi:hypothetical protein
LLTALVFAACVALAAFRLWSIHIGLVAMVFAVITMGGFIGLTIAPDAIAYRRGHYWRWWWRSSTDDGPTWPGTRIPRGRR